jgi:glycine dehydrogenase
LASVTDEPNNILKTLPIAMLTADTWLLPYSREKAAYPLEYVADNKFWPSVRRVDETYGDRNLICSCSY